MFHFKQTANSLSSPILLRSSNPFLANLSGSIVKISRSRGGSNRASNPSSKTTIPEPGNSLAMAELQSTASFVRNQQVSKSDRHDFYQLTVGESGVFSATLNGLSGDADVRLIHDRNQNGAIDPGEVIAWQWERGKGSELIRRFIGAGNYFVQVMNRTNKTANYTLTTTFTPAATDDRQFSIQVNFAPGARGLDAATRNAVLDAAQFCEAMIPYTSFSRSQTLTIQVGGALPQWNDRTPVVAAGVPTQANRDTAGRMMPIAGTINVNTTVNATSHAASSFDFNTIRRIFVHEMLHVLGFGTFWGTQSFGRNLINRKQGTYSAKTNAGWAYSELLGLSRPIAIPVTTGTGTGSDWMHWREDRFDNELMTPIATGNRGGMPLSQVTIAALRDLGWNVNYGVAEAFSLFR